MDCCGTVCNRYCHFYKTDKIQGIWAIVFKPNYANRPYRNLLTTSTPKDVGLKTISDQITVSGTKVSIDPLPEGVSYNDLKDDSGSIKYISKHERNTFQFRYDSKYEVGRLVTKEGYHRDLSYEDLQYLIERGAKVDK